MGSNAGSILGILGVAMQMANQAESQKRQLKPPPVREKLPAEDVAGAEARERERRRLGNTSRQNVISGRRDDALSGGIGKRTLGGEY